MKNLFVVFLLSFALRTEAANMVRVIEVRNDASIVVDRNGTREIIRLGGIQITDVPHAASLLQWTIGNSWVMLEGSSVYRSPDAMFVNRELVLRGYARATSPDTEAHRTVTATYLGELDSGPGPRISGAGRQPSPEPRTSSSKSRRSTRSRRRGR